ncbi:MAG: HNH endonuclease [Synergistaceae bacterium]
MTQIDAVIEALTQWSNNPQNEPSLNKLKSSTIREITMTLYPEIDCRSFLPSDYCYNHTNKGDNNRKFLLYKGKEGRSFLYKFVGEDFNYKSDKNISEEQTKTLSIKNTVKLEQYEEGTVFEKISKIIERSAEAREKALAYHGYNCKICGFNFHKVYGNIGKNYIHVHHIKPISKIKETYLVDPIHDLVPLCPNCHAMIHKLDDVENGIEILKNLLKKE